MSNAEEPRYVPALDGLRGIAILLVVLFHTAVIAPKGIADGAYLSVASYGFSGVDLFFVLSGYLITGILLDLEPSRRALGSFYARRALRTLPLYYAVVAFAFVALPRFVPPDKAARFGAATADAPYYLLHLSNVAIARAHAFRHPVVDIAWSLAIEEQFYLLWPLLVIGRSPRSVARVAVAAMATALLVRVALAVTGRDPIEIYVLTPCRMDGLAAGALIAAIARSPGGLAVHRATALRALAVAAPVAVLSGVPEILADGVIVLPGTAWPLATLGFSFVSITWSALLVVTLTAPPGSALPRALATPLLTTFGKLSYGIYLVHLPIRALIRDRVLGPRWSHAPLHFPVIHGAEIVGQIAFAVLSAAAALGLAWVSYNAFEVRFLQLKDRFPLGARGGPRIP